MMLFHMLGEDAFWKGIHAYLEKYKFQPATTRDFFEAMSKSSGRDLSGFEKQWYHTPVTPSLTVSISGSDLVVTQLAPYYTMDLPVWVMERNRDSLGRQPPWRKLSIHIAGAESRLTLPDHQSDFSAERLPAFLIDPEAWTPMEITYDYKFSTEAIQEMYGYAPNDAERARLIDEFFDKIPVTKRIELCSSEKSIGLRQMILSHIGADGSNFLVSELEDSDQRIVNSAVMVLGKLSQTDKAESALQAVAKNDPNETVREHATQVLLKWTTSPELAGQTWNLKAFDDGFRKMAIEWYGEHDPDKARSMCLEIVPHPDSEPLRITAIQVLGRVKEKPGDHAVYEALIKVAQETSFGARREAINALGQLGHKAAIAILQPITTHAPGGIRGAASAAIDRLNKQ
jgi:aminopeptidase N